MTQNTETTAPVLVLASGNAGKIREFQAMFAPLGVRVAGQKEYGVRSCDEPYGTFIENCLAKARHAAKETGLPAMADDSGLCVDALGGAPASSRRALRARTGTMRPTTAFSLKR